MVVVAVGVAGVAGVAVVVVVVVVLVVVVVGEKILRWRTLKDQQRLNCLLPQ